MSSRIAVWGLLAALLGCASPGVAPSRDTIVLDESLLRVSEYVDIVYEDGVYSYVSYLTENDLPQDRKGPACAHPAQRPADYSKGIWIWDYRKVVGREQETIERLQREEVRKVYLQIGGNLESLSTFLKAAKTRGITVYALDGSPDYIDDYQVLIDDIVRIREFNRSNRDAGFEGIQIDVEPYLKKDFNLRKEYYMRQFVKMARELRQHAGDDVRLSFALPFWFDTLIIDETPLSVTVIDIADEVVIMSYRTDYNEIIDSASQELCYGSTVGKPVYLGLEINRLPSEEHFIVRKSDIEKYSSRGGSATVVAKGPREGLPIVRGYEVKADKITFFSRRNALPGILGRAPQYTSFGGYVIHSYEGL